MGNHSNKMNVEKIPLKLRHLLPVVEKWGIEDDGYRDELVEKADRNELKLLTESLKTEDANELDTWFTNSAMVNNPSEEYLKFSAFFMAYEYAKAELTFRQNQ